MRGQILVWHVYVWIKIHTHAHTHTHMHAHTHAHAYTHTHTQVTVERCYVGPFMTSVDMSGASLTTMRIPAGKVSSCLHVCVQVFMQASV